MRKLPLDQNRSCPVEDSTELSSSTMASNTSTPKDEDHPETAATSVPISAGMEGFSHGEHKTSDTRELLILNSSEQLSGPQIETHHEEYPIQDSNSQMAATVTDVSTTEVCDQELPQIALPTAGPAKAQSGSTAEIVKEQERSVAPDAEDEDTTDDEKLETVMDHLTDEVRYRHLKRPLSQRLTSSKKRSLQASQYLVLIEDRLKELEATVKHLKAISSDGPGDNVKGDAANAKKSGSATKEKQKLSLKSELFSWRRFQAPSPEDSEQAASVLDILTEPPHPLMNGITTKAVPVREPLDEGAKPPVERVRFNSPHMARILREILDDESVPSRSLVHLKPFKAIVPYATALRAKAAELRERIDSLPETEEPKNTASTMDSVLPFQLASLGETDGDADKSRDRDELTETWEHLMVLVHSLDDELCEELEIHQRLRERRKAVNSSNADKVSFSELWHLFAPGDLVYDPAECQALRVLAVRGGRPRLVDQRANETYLLDPKESITAANDILTLKDHSSDFTLACFYLDFDGTHVGPVQTERSVKPFDGTRDIQDLSIVPMEYADPQTLRLDRFEGSTTSQQTVQDILHARGKEFALLARSGDTGKWQEYTCNSFGMIADSHVLPFE